MPHPDAAHRPPGGVWWSHTSTSFAIRHREAPERVRGQVFTTGASLKTTAFSLGAALAGALAAHQLPITLLTAAGFQTLAAIAFVIPQRDKGLATGEPCQPSEA